MLSWIERGVPDDEMGIQDQTPIVRWPCGLGETKSLYYARRDAAMPARANV